MPSRVLPLPDDVLLLALSALAFRELTHVAAVCGHWRTVVFHSAAFCGDVRVEEMTHWRLMWAHAQLSAGHRDGTPLALEIACPTYDRRLATYVLRWMHECLPRVVRLALYVNQLHVCDVWDHLRAPACRLEAFELTLCADDGVGDLHRYPVPSDIFGCAPGKLRTVRLSNAFLPDATRTKRPREGICGPPAFRRVETLSLSYAPGTWHHVSTAMHETFPDLDSVRLSDTPDGCLSRRTRERAFYAEDDLHALRGICAGSGKGVVIAAPSEEAVYTALDGMLSPFHMLLTSADERSFHITVSSDTTKSERHFLEATEDYGSCTKLQQPRNALFANDAFAAQLSSLTISLSLWPLLARRLPAYDELPRLVVLIDTGRRYGVSWLPEQPLPCDQLQELVLRGVGGRVTLDVRDILHFVDRLTLRGGVRLELVDVVLQGRKKRLRERFTDVRYRS